MRLLLLLVWGWAAIAFAAQPGKGVAALPLQPSSVGRIEVDIAEQRLYAVQVVFRLKQPSRFGSIFDRESPEDAQRLAALLRSDKSDQGVPARFRVRIFPAAGGEPVLDAIADQPRTSATYMGRYATLASTSLSPGSYSVRVEFLEGAPELAPLNAQITLNRTHHGK